MSEFKIRQEDSDDAITLVVSGDLDLAVSPMLRDHLHAVFEKKPKRIIVSMKEVTMMDSSGIAVLIEALRYCSKRNMGLALASPSDPVIKVLELARLDKGVFEIINPSS